MKPLENYHLLDLFSSFFFASSSGRVQKSHPAMGFVFLSKKKFFYRRKYLKYLIQITSNIPCNYSWARPPRT